MTNTLEKKMDKDQIEGKLEDVKGRIKRQVGEWVGDEKTQAEGAVEQVKGKIQNAWGKVKDAGRDVLDHNKEPDKEPKPVDRKEDDPAA
jgi:uncharacterized protein YjbJ (UPF0337 family)